MQAGAVAAIVAGAMLIAMTLIGPPLEELKTIVETPPNDWPQLVPKADWTVKLFGLSAFTFIAGFFSNEAAAGVAGIAFILWLLHRGTASGLGGEAQTPAPVPPTLPPQQYPTIKLPTTAGQPVPAPAPGPAPSSP